MIRVCVVNDGFTAWPAAVEEPPGPVMLGAHLLAEGYADIEWDYAREPLPNDLTPGENATLSLGLRAPAVPGVYVVELDLVAEHLAWFEDFGSPTVRLSLRVE